MQIAIIVIWVLLGLLAFRMSFNIVFANIIAQRPDIAENKTEIWNLRIVALLINAMFGPIALFMAIRMRNKNKDKQQ